jgi:hypothetical protein
MAKVTLIQKDNKWQLLRDGKPYEIKGAGGNQKPYELKRAGGNSIRSWGAENAERDLNLAHAFDMTLCLGIWLGHKEHGFKYDDTKMVADQLATASAVVTAYKDHPALLVWGLGNEMEGDGKDDNVWKAIEAIAKRTKELDPNHPTVTVIAELGENGIKAKKVKELCPSVDILGVNTYGGADSLPKRLKEAGWTKPYIVTEFGPNGPWEVRKTAWGVPLEPSSTEKGKVYKRRYQEAVVNQKGWCLGGYVFLWSDKFEGTATWFGMFLPHTSEHLAQVVAMSEVWGGKPSTLAPVPEITSLKLGGSDTVAPRSKQTATCVAIGAGDLSYHFEITPETSGPSRPEPGQMPLSSVTGSVPPPSKSGSIQFSAPSKPGSYRLFVYVRNGLGGAATANVPFLVK